MESLALEPVAGGTLLPLKVVPGATREGIRGFYSGRLRIAVTAAPEKGKANRAVVDLLEHRLHLPHGTVEIHKGAASSMKSVLVRGLDPDQVRERVLAAAAQGR